MVSVGGPWVMLLGAAGSQYAEAEANATRMFS